MDFLSDVLVTKNKENPDKTVFLFEYGVHGEERITYRDLYANTMKIVHELRSIDIGPGDSFAMIMRNYPEFIYLLCAAAFTGATAVPIDPRSTGERLQFMLRFSDAKAAFVTGDLVSSVTDIRKGLPGLKHIYVLKKTGIRVQRYGEFPSLNEVIDTGNDSWTEPAADDPARAVELIFTSGTTGDPKGVVMRQERFPGYAMLAQIAWGYSESDVLYTGLSFTHGNAQAVTILPALALGLQAVISPQFTKSRIWDICRKYGVTTFSLLGGMMSGIYNEPRKADDADNPVRVVLSAGTPRSIWEAFEKRFAVRIHEWYGAVEGGFAHKSPGEGPVGSFGKPLPGIMEMKIFGDDDRECRPGESGEIVWRMTGQDAEVTYYKNKQASEEKTRGGWLRTGDIGHTDEDGYFFFDYRRGGGLRRQGEFIQPDFVEKIIGEHPDVSEVCVYGIPASSGAPGESDLVAAIVPFDSGKIDPAALLAQCREKLTPNTVPAYIQLVNEIPKTISEKPLDLVLRKNFDPSAKNVYKA